MKKVVILEEDEYLTIKLKIERALKYLGFLEVSYTVGRIDCNLTEALNILEGKGDEE